MSHFRKKIYADYASTAPVSKNIVKAMQPFWTDIFYNPSGLYKEGVMAKQALQKARSNIAKVLHVQSQNLTFTSGGTESIFIAIWGAIEYAKSQGLKNPHIITSTFEHPAVLMSLRHAEKNGVAVTYVNPGADGKIKVENVIREIKKETVLITIMYVNNEIGTIEPIRTLSNEIKKIRVKNKSAFPYFHTDACQAPNYLVVDPHTLGVDLLTLDGGKIYGPKGIGLLYIRSGVNLKPVLFGGGQEHGLRPGTEPMPLIIGLAAAIEETSLLREKEARRIMTLRDYFLKCLEKMFFRWSLNGSLKDRIPNNVNICIEGLQAEFAVIALGEEGIMVSPGTACDNLNNDINSRTIEAIGRPFCSKSSLRFTFGRGTVKKDIEMICKLLPKIVALCSKKDIPLRS